jgi:NAD(P)H-nitrite reductase large subunit
MRYVIIGNSAAGVAAAWTIRQRDATGHIEVISDEAHVFYSRILLPYWIANRVAPTDLDLARREDYTRRAVELRLEERVEGIDAAAHRLYTSRRSSVPYDRLLVATGASATRPRTPGVDLRGVETLRVREDAERILSRLSRGSPVVIAGGGLVGVRAAEALAARGARVHLVVTSRHVLSQMLDLASAEIVLRRLEAHGIDVRLSTEVREFFGHGELEAVALSDGTEVRAGLALVAKGVQPNTSCVRGTGVVIGLGIEVDRYLATGAPEVYAAGDVAEAYDPLRGKPWLNALWPMAVEQGRTAALNMTGSRVCYGGSIRMNAVEIFGYPCVSIGHVYDLDGTPSFVRHDRRAQSYRKLFVQGDRLVGAVLMGDVRGAGILAERIRFPRPSSAGWLDETLVFGPRFGRHLDADREAA